MEIFLYIFLKIKLLMKILMKKFQLIYIYEKLVSIIIFVVKFLLIKFLSEINFLFCICIINENIVFFFCYNVIYFIEMILRYKRLDLNLLKLVKSYLKILKYKNLLNIMLGLIF